MFETPEWKLNKEPFCAPTTSFGYDRETLQPLNYSRGQTALQPRSRTVNLELVFED
jgi:hypothetical protein